MEMYKPDACLYKGQLHKGYGIVVDNGTIIDIDVWSKLKEKYNHVPVTVWDGLFMTPGTVNAHNHCFQSLLRGLAVDTPFLEWRDKALYNYSPKMRLEDVYNGAVFAFTEMMCCGATTVCDFFYLHKEGIEDDEAIIQAAKDVGIRLVLARTMYDWDGAPDNYVETVPVAADITKKLMIKYNGSTDMTKIIPAPHSLHAASIDMITAGHQLAKELGTPYHIHVAEEPFEVEQVKKKYGMTPIHLLDSLGVVDDTMAIVHGVWLTKEEIKLLGSKGGKLIYCPSSNMFLGDGISNISLFMQNGIDIALGTDGGCSNNRISVFEEMRMCSLLQKAVTLDALCINYHDVFKMGTSGGAAVLNIPVGELKIGYKADFLGIQYSDLSLQPITNAGNQFLPNLVYSMQPAAMQKVVVNGKETVTNGSSNTVSKSKVLQQIASTMEYLEYT